MKFIRTYLFPRVEDRRQRKLISSHRRNVVECPLCCGAGKVVEVK